MTSQQSSQIAIKKSSKATTKEELNTLSNEELVERLLSLQAHNLQLKNIITKNLAKNRSETAKTCNEQTNDACKGSKKQRPFDFNKCTFRHVLLKFYYLGWDYQGFVVQEDTTNTIEYYLFEALIKTCLIPSREESNYHRCGRTDKGVSSFSQVISIDLRSKLSKDQEISNIDEEIDYCQVLNRVLPEDIQCVAWRPVANDFSARFDCNSRSYKYFFPQGSLNIAKMQTGCTFLLGTHDFRNLCKMDVANGVTEFVRSIELVDIQPFETNLAEYSMYVFNIKSKGFLWHQIRCIMAVLFLIGEEKEQPEIIRDLFNVDTCTRKPDYNMASEIALNLFNCDFNDCGEEWQVSQTSLSVVLKKLQSQWTIANVKSTMIKAMLNELCVEHTKDNEFVNCLSQDNKTKRYVALMQRPKCDSLENKIEHYLKRRKIEVKTQSESK